VAGSPADIRARERLTTQLRETLGGERFDAEFESGRALSRDDALVIATDTARAVPDRALP